MSRLDHFLVDEQLVIRVKYFTQQGMCRSISDHIPLLLSKDSVDWGPRPFKFLNAWLTKPECLNLITEVWSGLSGVNTKLTRKLRNLKLAIKDWNEKSGGNVKEKKRRIESIERKVSDWDEIGNLRKLKEKGSRRN